MNAVESGDELRRPRDETAYGPYSSHGKSPFDGGCRFESGWGHAGYRVSHEPARSRKRRRSMTAGATTCRDLYYAIVDLLRLIARLKTENGVLE